MTNTQELELMIQDGALMVKFKKEGKEIFKKTIAGDDFKKFWELMKGKVELENHQHVEQTDKWKGTVNSIELMLDYVYTDQFQRGWAESFYEVLGFSDQVGKEVLAKLKPTDVEVMQYRERCGPTGYPLLKYIQTKHLENFTISSAPTFELYKAQCPTKDGHLVSASHRQDMNYDCSGLRRLWGENCIRNIDASKLISELKEGERLLLFNQGRKSRQIGDAIAKAAVQQELICIRKRYPATTEVGSEEGEAKYFIESGLPDNNDGNGRAFMDGRSMVGTEEFLKVYNYDNETERSYRYLQKSQRKCLIIVEDCDGVMKNQTVGERRGARDYLGNVVNGKILFSEARVVIISCAPKVPALCFQCNIPDRYASVCEAPSPN